MENEGKIGEWQEAAPYSEKQWTRIQETWILS